ncbi:hypothetical protein [Phormidesmis priestleyi]|nr:hypothetical protein [Phormidesmis priestleyi]
MIKKRTYFDSTPIAEDDPDALAKVILKIQAGVNQLEGFPVLG